MAFATLGYEGGMALRPEKARKNEWMLGFPIDNAAKVGLFRSQDFK
jgi:hypothetical protein